MEFLNFPALYALGALPLLLVPYLIRRKPRRYVFSSLLLLEAFATRPEQRFWGRLRLPLLFFLQLVVLALLVAAAGDPILRELTGQRLAIVLDNSASMQTAEGGISRFDRAKREATRALGGVSAGSRVDLYLTVPWTGIVGQDLTVGAALAAVNNAKAYDLADAVRSYRDLFDRLSEERDYDRILLFTDRPVRGANPSIQSFAVGRPQGNVAITGFDVSRGGLGSADPSARVEIANFSTKEHAIETVLLGDGKRRGSQQRHVAAGRTIVVEFDRVPAAAYYEARVELGEAEGDPLSVDNRRFAVAPAATTRILGVSPRAAAVESLRAVPGLEVDVIQPEAYPDAADQKYGLEIFHLAAPRELPRNNALLILPPEENPVVLVGVPETDANVSGWSETHPLTRYVNVTMLRPSYSRPLDSRVPARSVLEGPSGSLALVFEREGFRYAVLGFDPLPFLGSQNLPMAIFTLNVLGWLGDGMATVNQSTGDPLRLAGDARRNTLTPERGHAEAEAGASQEPPVLFQGVYERFRNGNRELVAVNFDAPEESDLLHPAAIVLEKAAMRTGPAKGDWPLWPYVIMVCLALLTLEWFVNPPKPEGR